MDNEKNLVETINELLTEKNFGKLQQILNEQNPVDIALLFDELDDNLLPIAFRLLSKEKAAETFVEMESEKEEVLINAFTDAELRAVFDEMFIDDTVDIIEEMPASVVKRIISQSDNETRKMINEILQYPKDSAGSLMTVEYVSLKKKLTVKQCFERIRRDAIDKETIYNCYVTDEHRCLIGTISVKTMLLNPPDASIENLMETNIISINTHADKEAVAQIFHKYGLSALPVVDSENRIVGIITVDDAIDVLQEEVSEDFSKMAAVTPSDTPYLDQSVWRIWLNRVPWLLILMISATFTGLILNTYEATLSALSTVLIACVPMLMDSAGNAGSQASVTVTRGIALGEINFKDAWKVLWKEVRVSILLAAVLAVACFGKLILIDGLLFGYAEYYEKLQIPAAVALTLFATIVMSKIVGCLLPILAKKVKLDPAIVASTIITTIVDALALIVYCNVAVALMSGI